MMASQALLNLKRESPGFRSIKTKAMPLRCLPIETRNIIQIKQVCPFEALPSSIAKNLQMDTSISSCHFSKKQTMIQLYYGGGKTGWKPHQAAPKTENLQHGLIVLKVDK